MRFLLVITHAPYPPTGGSRIRQAAVLDAFGKLGSLDVCIVGDEREWRQSIPHPAVRKVLCLRRPAPATGQDGRLPGRRRLVREARWWLTGAPGALVGVAPPRRIAAADRRALRERILAWADGDYDAVWLDDTSVGWWLAGELPGPTILDLDDRPDLLLMQRRADLSATDPQRLVFSALARAYRAASRGAIARSTVVVVPSDADARRAADLLPPVRPPHLVVVPNAYPAPAYGPDSTSSTLGEHGRGSRGSDNPPGDPPTVALVGHTGYPPNLEGMRWFCADVLPHLRSRVPRVRVLLVGSGTDTIPEADLDGIEALGWVRDMRPVLAQTDVLAVPLLSATGTRLKILEAFAHCIPVVSTTVGAEGLPVVAGEHLLVSDDPESFAESCAAALSEETVRVHVVANARRLWKENFTPQAVRSAIRRAVELASGRNPCIDA
ncbi:MAG: hypothetical protein KatS3mg008_0024 [Acidimicrobiales bacterium]|nr:MAG: hypothetical protein KatS3mg008_0024 [Acidimicrobiales bacterium]